MPRFAFAFAAVFEHQRDAGARGGFAWGCVFPSYQSVYLRLEVAELPFAIIGDKPFSSARK